MYPLNMRGDGGGGGAVGPDPSDKTQQYRGS